MQDRSTRNLTNGDVNSIQIGQIVAKWDFSPLESIPNAGQAGSRLRGGLIKE